MGLFVLKDCVAFVGGHDFTAETNEAALNLSAQEKESTTFGSGGSREYKAGLKTGELALGGHWQAGADTVDADTFTNLGTANSPITLSPTGVAGDAAYLGQFGRFNYALFPGGIGEMADFKLGCRNTDGVGVVRGMLAAAKQTKSATGALGSVLNLGAPTSTQYVYAVLHVFSAGTTITVQIQSDDSAGMGSPTTRGTIGPITTAGGTWMTRVAGPFAGETHWRMNISAITGTFEVAGGIAVQ